ncbi:DUF899 domain-containing protein [Micromonospora cathayae]|uniref:DUF899 domain-containing protein n=1 Tax=Micromonospora cathayae TaxID=3028804 RepID=A0ABY7ZNF6_9ACTN|nr:DUF899 domain-containing protein [Micromonospora sp. HUAS 3]WDZ83588.1 DUF899 domain-containing protein [Micromonospora sp. HUAS 3]
MVDLPVVARDEWLTARRELLDQEKELTRLRDRVTASRRQLPAVAVDKEYTLTGPDGPVRLADLFEGRRQLIVYHFMFDPAWTEGCSSCSLLVDNVGHLAHLRASDTTFAVVSRAPLSSITPFRDRMGWTFPWYSSHGSDFNYDFHVTNDPDVAPVEYNYKDAATLEQEGLTPFLRGEAHGLSVFVRSDDGRVLHTYSTYGRGLDPLLNTYNYLDLTPLGRQRYVNEFPHHDTYDTPSTGGHCH